MISEMSQSPSIGTIFKLGFTKNADWGSDSEVFLDFIYYSRQIVGLIVGVIWGFLGITGVFGLATFGLSSAGFCFLYCTLFNIDAEAFGGIYEVIKEGFMTNFASFLVTWIIVYSSFYGDEITMSKS